MRPKVEACIRAATSGVERTHIIDGRIPDALLLEVFTGAGCGTMIVGRKEKAAYLGGDLAAETGEDPTSDRAGPQPAARPAAAAAAGSAR
jgi:hypothetical protein